jgi:hypothetical protein
MELYVLPIRSSILNMAKHRKTTRLNPAMVILSLFLGVLFVLSLFSFVDLRNSPPFAASPPTSQKVIPGTPAAIKPGGIPPVARTQNAPQDSPSSRVLNTPAPSVQPQKPPVTQKNVTPPTNNNPPLPLPTVPVVPTTKPLLRLDNGLEVNVPLLNLGVTVAPLKVR